MPVKCLCYEYKSTIQQRMLITPFQWSLIRHNSLHFATLVITPPSCVVLLTCSGTIHTSVYGRQGAEPAVSHRQLLASSSQCHRPQRSDCTLLRPSRTKVPRWRNHVHILQTHRITMHHYCSQHIQTRSTILIVYAASALGPMQ